MGIVRKNIFSMFASQASTWIATLALLVLAPKRLDAEGFGQLAFAMTYVSVFTLLGGLGAYPYIVRRVVRDHEDLASLIRANMRLKLMIGIGLSIVAIGLVVLLGYRGETLGLVAIFCCIMMVNLQVEIVVAGLGASERMSGPALWQAVQVYVGAILSIVVLFTTRSLLMFAATGLVACLIPLIANYIALRPTLRDAADRGTVVRLPWRPIVVGGLPLMTLSILLTVYGSIDVPILDWISGSEVVGWYAVALKWAAMPIFINTIIGVAFFTRMAAAAGHDPELFAELSNRALRLALFVTIPMSVGLILISPDILHLIYDQEYNKAISLMQILSLQIPIVALDSVLVSALIAANRQNRFLWVALAAAVLNPIAAVLAIQLTETHYDNGAIGAAIVTVATEVFISIWVIRMRPEGVLNRHTVGFGGRCVLATLSMAAVVLLFHDTELFVKVIAGGAIYLVASLALGTVSFSRAKSTVSDVLRSRNRGSGDNNDGSHEMSDAGADS